MKNKKIIKSIALAATLSTVATVSAFAGAGLREIKAYLDYDVKIKHNLEEIDMLDENGARIYPISYNGEIYLPVTQIGYILDVDTKYDETDNTVLLGMTGETVDFIDTYKPVYNRFKHNSNIHVSSDLGKTTDIGGKKYSKYIRIYAYRSNDPTFLSYDIEGKYSILQFDIKSEAYRDDSISILGDDDKLLYKINMKHGDVFKTVQIDVTGVSQIKIVSNQDTQGIVGNGHDIYIVNAFLK